MSVFSLTCIRFEAVYMTYFWQDDRKEEHTYWKIIPLVGYRYGSKTAIKTVFRIGKAFDSYRNIDGYQTTVRNNRNTS